MTMNDPTSLPLVESHSALRRYRFIAAGLIILGIALRLRRFLLDRGLMHDEALLAGNVLANPIAAMFKPLKMGDQAAPVGFLLAEKLFTLAMGSSEYVIRLLPLLASIAALVLFYRLATRTVGRPAALIGLAFMALAEPLIYYAAEGKQYSTDVLCTLIVLSPAIRPTSRAKLAILAGTGALLIWCSHPVLFVLAGVGLVMLSQALHNKALRDARNIAAAITLWLTSFITNYLLVTCHYTHNDYLTSYWTHFFAPAPISITALDWYWRTLVGWFRFPIGSGKAARLALICFVVGCVLLWKHSRAILGLCALPLVIAIAASAARRYPVSERLMLWAAPLLLMPIAYAIGGKLCINRCWRCARLAILITLLVYPLYLAGKYTWHPPVLYDVKPGLKYVRSHWQPGDVLYLHYGANVLTNYYLTTQPGVGPDAVRPIQGSFPDGHPEKYETDISNLGRHARVWVLFAMSPEDRPVVDAALDRHGYRLDQARLNGSTAELYDLSQK